MNFVVLTLFPDMIRECMNTSIMGRAISGGIINLNVIDIRDFSQDKHKHVDDYPYGGGAGMVMMAPPVYDACEHARGLCSDGKGRIIYMSPSGRKFDQSIAKELSKYDDLIFLCGHYEGIDERVIELEADDAISLGDFVLTGGELPAVAIMDAVSRLVPGVLNNDMSACEESFEDNLLEYPQYTRPEIFMNKSVPDVLLSGHHANIAKWRRERSIERTAQLRPDLLINAVLNKKEEQFLRSIAEIKNNDLRDIQNRNETTD
ncbi:MAG: tRNA (guanosine(37)-N1)-methyltransferase TrmD [Lachnospiraceae bacterium]|nr:tRNA (guanosine(37)-N1)-methyltransferase TrmD [Lachnospiraceae bacterium]